MKKDVFASLGSVCALVGTQWGDEGKGKITDALMEHYDIIARATGGANAGHTVKIGDKSHVFHLLPSGSLRPEKVIVLGAGMAIHLPTLMEEIQTLKDMGVDVVPRLYISPAAHIVFRFHKQIDAINEEKRAKTTHGEIGTTKRGIGPTYVDKAMRTGIRMGDLQKKNFPDLLAERIASVQKMYGITVETAKELEDMVTIGKMLVPRIIDTAEYVHNECGSGKKILIEGTQGFQLDVDHGSYPYVTSCPTTLAGLLQGTGLAPQLVTSCIGVLKAYSTRVGSGPFVTEVLGATADRLRERGGEYGATTGRPRRCGWLYMEDIATAVRVNGITHLAVTKIDVLDEEETIPVGTRKSAKDDTVEFQEMPGWRSSTGGKQSMRDLPGAAVDYIHFIEQLAYAPVAFIGTGQEREDIITDTR